MRRWKMVIWGSFRPFLSSLGMRRDRAPFFFLSCSPCAEFVCHFLLQIPCSCAGEFSRHFVSGKSLHVPVFFFHGKIFFTKKKIFEDFFPEVEKPCVEISKKNKNCRFPQKCGKMEALNVWVTLKSRSSYNRTQTEAKRCQLSAA